MCRGFFYPLRRGISAGSTITTNEGEKRTKKDFMVDGEHYNKEDDTKIKIELKISTNLLYFIYYI